MKERYREIFSNYQEKRFGEVKVLFYICNTLQQLKKLAKLAECYRWVYFAMYDQLMQKHADTIFVNQKDQFRLKELL